MVLKFYLTDGAVITSPCAMSDKRRYIDTCLKNGINCYINGVETWFPPHAIAKVEVH